MHDIDEHWLNSIEKLTELTWSVLMYTEYKFMQYDFEKYAYITAKYYF